MSHATDSNVHTSQVYLHTTLSHNNSIQVYVLCKQTLLGSSSILAPGTAMQRGLGQLHFQSHPISRAEMFKHQLNHGPLSIGIALLLYSACVWQLATRTPPFALAECQQCSTSSGVQCLNETAFQACFAGSVVRQCPPGTVCYDNAAICGNASLIAADCPRMEVQQRCSECSADGRYACVNATAFGLCFGGSVVQLDYVFGCPQGEWCNLEAAATVAGAFCSPTESLASCTSKTLLAASATSESTETATTLTPETTTITEQPRSTNVTVLCQSYQMRLRYPHPDDTTNCRRYFYCYLYNGEYRGQTFDCSGTSIFCQRQQRCVSPYTYRCQNGFVLNATDLSIC